MKTSKGHICKGCKNPLPCRTPGCQQCKWRHNYNVSIGKAPKRRRCCKTCGTPYTDFNMDCDLCRKRYRVKLIREAGDEHEPKTCAGCGGKINQFTTGCKTCMKRRWSRAKKSKPTNTTANMQQMRIRHDLPQPQMQNLQIPRRIKQKTRQTPTHPTNHPRARTKTKNKGNPRPTHHRNATRTSRIHPRSPGKAQEKN